MAGPSARTDTRTQCDLSRCRCDLVRLGWSGWRTGLTWAISTATLGDLATRAGGDPVALP